MDMATKQLQPAGRLLVALKRSEHGWTFLNSRTGQLRLNPAKSDLKKNYFFGHPWHLYSSAFIRDQRQFVLIRVNVFVFLCSLCFLLLNFRIRVFRVVKAVAANRTQSHPVALKKIFFVP
jgi:hypothetical protein